MHPDVGYDLGCTRYIDWLSVCYIAPPLLETLAPLSTICLKRYFTKNNSPYNGQTVVEWCRGVSTRPDVCNSFELASSIFRNANTPFLYCTVKRSFARAGHELSLNKVKCYASFPEPQENCKMMIARRFRLFKCNPCHSSAAQSISSLLSQDWRLLLQLE